MNGFPDTSSGPAPILVLGIGVVGVEPESITTGFGLSNHVQEALPAASDEGSCLLSELC
jgi:hypothetical protein